MARRVVWAESVRKPQAQAVGKKPFSWKKRGKVPKWPRSARFFFFFKTVTVQSCERWTMWSHFALGLLSFCFAWQAARPQQQPPTTTTSSFPWQTLLLEVSFWAQGLVSENFLSLSSQSSLLFDPPSNASSSHTRRGFGLFVHKQVHTALCGLLPPFQWRRQKQTQADTERAWKELYVGTVLLRPARMEMNLKRITCGVSLSFSPARKERHYNTSLSGFPTLALGVFGLLLTPSPPIFQCGKIQNQTLTEN